MLATFATMEAAAETVSAIIAAKIVPSPLEFLDRKTIHCVEDFAKVGLPTDAEALLLIETVGHPVAVADEATQIETIAKANGATSVKRIAGDTGRVAPPVVLLAEAYRREIATRGSAGL